MSKNRDVSGRGSIIVEKTRIVFEHHEAVNFPYARRFEDGTVWLNISIGGHTTDAERPYYLWSLDNGETWKEAGVPIHSGAAATVLSDGTILSSPNCPAGKKPENGNYWPFILHRREIPQSPPKEITTGVRLPFLIEPSLYLYDFFSLGNREVLASAYGNLPGERYRTYVMKSGDGGRTWSYLSTIAQDGPGEVLTGREGPCEPGWARTADGSILCLMRTGGPLWAARSCDNGKTWKQEPPLEQPGSCPRLYLMSNGVLVALFGSYRRQLQDNPKITLLVDYEGTGKKWDTEIVLYRGESSGYTSIVEVEPGLLMLFYDESAFHSGRSNGGEQFPLNRIMAAYVRITRN